MTHAQQIRTPIGITIMIAVTSLGVIAFVLAFISFVYLTTLPGGWR